MNVRLRSANLSRGNVLVAALVIGAVVGLSLAAYLSWASTQNRLIMRSQIWNGALPLAEAGLEEALTHLTISSNKLAEDGWTLSGVSYVKKRALGDGYYVVEIETNANPIIISEGFARAPLHTDQYISRKVRVTVTNQPVYIGALVSDLQIDLNGNTIFVDSYDTSDPSYNTGGLYDPLKTKDNGTVASNLGITNSLMVGDADIFGKVLTGPGGTVQIGPNGAVGSVAWQAAGNKGIQPGWSSDDFNLPIAPVPGPTSGSVTSGGTVGGVSYNHVLTDGNWEVSDLSGSVYVSGNANLIVKSSVNFSSSDKIVIAPGATLKMWVNAPDVNFFGKTVNNQSGLPDSFHYYGTANNTSLKLGGAVEFNGVINAPAAAVTFGGGGGTPINISGAMIAKNIVINGRINMHFDETLKKKYFKGYAVTSWTEL